MESYDFSTHIQVYKTTLLSLVASREKSINLFDIRNGMNWIRRDERAQEEIVTYFAKTILPQVHEELIETDYISAFWMIKMGTYKVLSKVLSAYLRPQCRFRQLIETSVL